VGRLGDVAADAAEQYRGGPTRFYLALVLLALLTLTFIAVAVVYGIAGEPDSDQAVAGGVVGAVVCPALAVWGVHKFRRR
jgi:hypothetical protein